MTSPQIRYYQEAAVKAMIAASNTGGLLLCATGSGKTRIAGEYFACLKGSGCFIVDELALLEQSRRTIQQVIGEEVGIVGKSQFLPQRVTVATIQTLHKHRDKPEFRRWFKGLEVLIIDEIHLALNRRNIDIVQKIRPKAVFGLTATLELEKVHVQFPAQALAGPVLFTYSIEQGTAEGYLTAGVVTRVLFQDPLKGIAPDYWTRVDGKRVRIAGGSRPADYRYRIVLNRARNDCIEELIREGMRRGKRAVVMVEHRAHLQALSRRLKDIHHQVVCGAVKMEERLEAMRQMDAGKLPLILANRVFAKGVDIKSVNLILDATGQPGHNGVLQRYGRGTRKTKGKGGLIYLDIADLGNDFSFAARSRAQAFREIGCPIIEESWTVGARQIFDRSEEALLRPLTGPRPD
jgi:superfamily II DNA or RNA helicase